MARPQCHRRLPRLDDPRSRALFILCGLLVGLLSVPHEAKAWWNTDWTYREKVTIDAGPKGAALGEDPGRIPVLLRLHDGNFNFLEAKPDGSDLRVIADDDKTPLKFHVESYDGVLGIALVWVDLPSVKISAPTDLWLYWGNGNAPSVADPAGTYDGDMALVYHFGTPNAPAHDQTANGNNAATAATPIAASQIGSGVSFDGTSAVVIPASPSLTIAEGGAFTWSAWVKPGDPQSNATIFAKTDADRALIIGLDQNVPYVSIVAGATTQRTSPIDALTPGTWHHLAITASDHVTLFVDGQAKTTLALALPALSGPANLGGMIAAPAAVAAPAPDATAAAPSAAPAPGATTAATGALTGTGYAGELDELEISKTARSAGFIAAAFAGQGPDTKLISTGVEEQHAGWFSGGYMGVILKSVTMDGWVVIGLLIVMALISWVVMATKSIYVNRVAKANGRFLEIFTRCGGDFDRFEVETATTSEAVLANAALYHIYRAGADEIKRRFPGNSESHGPRILSTQAIATIRAILDRVATQEGQRLNRSMVLLTIAISGGPFLGLLGTVVGVMITFAAIAATGDVNITAIAPGMAAALVATVAGLGVAIPALFGYNYLVTRIKEIAADMHVFIDEFATRLAETYRARREPENLAAE